MDEQERDELREVEEMARIRELASGLTSEQLRGIVDEMQMFRVIAEKSEIPSYEIGTPKDPAVRLAAAWAFKVWRRPEFRQSAIRMLQRLDGEPISYTDIGEKLVNTSRERVRQVWESLCPLEYEEDRQQRTNAGLEFARTRVRGVG